MLRLGTYQWWTLRWTVLALLLATALWTSACDHEPADTDGRQDTNAVEWGYEGPGAPENWASLSEEYAACADGKQQSPVDITGYENADANPVSFSYNSDAIAVHNNGKFVYVDYPSGSTLSVGEQIFELKSAHFHSPSEHLIDGASFSAEMHLVHADAEGRLAVVAQLFRLGEPSAIVEALLDAAPAAGSTAGDGVTLNSGGYVPEDLGYYEYEGSKTTPPCDEPVNWFVMSESKTVSQEQVNRLLALSGGPNNRPVQPIGSRVITTSGVN